MPHVLVAADDILFLTRVRMWLATANDLQATIVRRSAAAEEEARRTRPDVTLVEFRDHEPAGTAELVRALATAGPLALLTDPPVTHTWAKAQSYGVTGILTRDMPSPDAVAAIRLLSTGATVLTPHLPRSRPEGASDTALLSHRLSEREREVLTLLSEGSSNVEIAQRLYLSPATVKGYVSTIYRKLGVANRVKATAFVHSQRHAPGSPPEGAQDSPGLGPGHGRVRRSLSAQS